MNLAKKHHNHVLKRKLMSAWRSLVETKWKQKVEKACQVFITRSYYIAMKILPHSLVRFSNANKLVESFLHLKELLKCLQTILISCLVLTYTVF